MAFEQSMADKRSVTIVSGIDDDGYYYFQLGSIRFYVGEGSPNGVITAPSGSLCIDTDATDKTDPNLYMNVDGGTTWEKVGSQS